MQSLLILVLVKAFFLIFVMSGSAETASVNTGKEVFHEHETLFDLYQPYLANISGYKPVYFLFGVDPEDTMFQLSMKYRFINPESLFAQQYPWVRGFHIAYTQTSFWDLSAESKPFDDTSYKPELFFLSPNLFSGRGQSHFFFQTGYEHESNGQAGDTSRSTNYLYIQPIYVFFHQKSNLGFQISPKIWTYLANTDSTNPDLDKYRGNFDLQFKVGRSYRFVLDTHWRWAEKGHSIFIDLTYPLDQLIRANPQLFVHVRYVNALAESLLDYTERNEAVRIGVSIVR
jgi:phospholipase A1/A2